MIEESLIAKGFGRFMSNGLIEVLSRHLSGGTEVR
jgi:hypothetical protein